MKLLCLCSALDIRYRFGCTPNWWQFMKGLAEFGVDIIAIPYLGQAFETPWWRCYPNPCHFEAGAFRRVKSVLGNAPTSTTEGWRARLTGAAIEHWIRPRWEAHLATILEKERDIDAVILFTIPMNHFTGLPARLRERYSVPFVYFDGDVPASLPRFGGFASGFRIYEGADLSEYDAILCNSEGGVGELLEMGARRVQAIHWGVDPDLYAPLDLEQDRDVFFYGFGARYRERWIEALITTPSNRMPEQKFAVGGQGFDLDLGRAQRVGNVPFNVFRTACGRSRINLNITREAHGSVFASSTMRPFELAAMGCCIVSGPYLGLETWFEPGTDYVMVDTADEAVQTYERLLADKSTRGAMGASARQRILERHTHRHRADEIAKFTRSIG